MSNMPATQVNLDQLEQAIRQVDQIKQYLETGCLNYMPAITRALGSATNVDMSDAEYQFTGEATVFGAFYSAYGMQARNDGVYRAMQTSIKQLIQHLDNVERNLRTIIQNYQATEDTNVQSGQNFDRILTSPPTDSSGGGVMYA